MTSWLWVRRSLSYHRRVHAAVVAGVAVAVAVLAGAYLVGASVQDSLRRLVLERLGRTGHVLSSTSFFRAALAGNFEHAAPMISIEAFVRNERTAARAAGVWLYGVDERFYQFHGEPGGQPAPRSARLSPALARELGVQPGDSLFLRFDEASAIPREFLHGRKENPSRVLRVTAREPVLAAAPAEFSLRAQQTEVRAVFVPLVTLQRALGKAGWVNTILLSGDSTAGLTARLRASYRLEDLGIRLRAGMLEHESTLLPDAVAEAAGGQGLFSYLANAMRNGSRVVPYSLVTASDDVTGFTLNEWAARELDARVGSHIQLDYYLWSSNGELREESKTFTVERIVPIAGFAAARDVVPEYPGITDSDSLAGWDPPFPLDLSRVRPRDEEYWKRYRTTPKAWLPLKEGQALWGTRFGRFTSMRVQGDIETRLKQRLDPLAAGLSLIDVRAGSLEASSGSTDFGGYFVAFSFFLLASALLLVGLFFRLGIEQRTGEIGLLRALGLPVARIRGLLLREAALLAVAGAALGALLACLYGAGVLYGLRTWWSGAVGTSRLALAVNAQALAGGAAGGIVVSLLTLWITLRALRKLSPKSLLTSAVLGTRPWTRRLGLLLLAAGLALLGAGSGKWLAAEAAFFGGGTLLLVSLLLFVSWEIRARRIAFVARPGAMAIYRLGARNAGGRAGRSVLALALIASATFLLISLESFRRDPRPPAGTPPLVAESQVPVFYDPNTAAGREALNLQSAPAAKWFSFRVRPGDDVSCLNLYQPRNPRILGAPASWNPPTGSEPDGTVPAIVDQNSMLYVLHKKVGDVVLIPREGKPAARLRLVSAPAGSLFQSELIISEENFLRLFPEQQGYRVFLIDAPVSAAPAFEDALSDYGFDATSTAERLASYHRVEDAYLSTFQSLGVLGLLLGTVGLSAVLFRNALERRRELALLRAGGWSRGQTAWLLVAETAHILLLGLVIGFVCAMAAVAPSVPVREAVGHFSRFGLLLAVILGVGLASSWIAARMATRAPLLESLRAE